MVSLRGFYWAHLKSHLPPRLHRVLHRASLRYDLWLLRPLPTRVLGPKWRRSRDTVEIDITYACDLGCFNCNRSCSQDPTNDHMSVGQVRQFLEESKERGIRWRSIRILGGEPTCHPDFREVVGLIMRYREEFSPETQVVLLTNGYSERARRLTSELPADVELIDGAKTTRLQPSFCTFNVAPIDMREYRRADFFNACHTTQLCGMGVTPYGYYPCAVAGAIDRTFGFDLGRKLLPQDDDDMEQELRTFCALCGKFKELSESSGEPLDGPVMSKIWVEAYERSRLNPARLSRLDERRPEGSTLN